MSKHYKDVQRIFLFELLFKKAFDCFQPFLYIFHFRNIRVHLQNKAKSKWDLIASKKIERIEMKDLKTLTIMMESSNESIYMSLEFGLGNVESCRPPNATMTSSAKDPQFLTKLLAISPHIVITAYLKKAMRGIYTNDCSL